MRIIIKLRAIKLAAILCLFFSTQLLANFVDGTELASSMQEWQKEREGSSDVDAMMVARYLTYVSAVIDTTEAAGMICAPDSRDVILNQLSVLVSNFLDANPERWDEAAPLLIYDAIKAALPCRD